MQQLDSMTLKLFPNQNDSTSYFTSGFAARGSHMLTLNVEKQPMDLEGLHFLLMPVAWRWRSSPTFLFKLFLNSMLK